MPIDPQEDEAPVLIAGGGLIGLSTAMFLAQHGITSLAIERIVGGSPLPRAAHFHLRTLELFRAAGIDEQVRIQSDKEFVPEGDVVLVDTLAGSKLADLTTLNVGVEAVSPVRRLFISQPGLEPILRERALDAGARVLEGHELVGVEQDDDGVTATVRNVEDDSARQYRAKYLVGADGGHSKVRDILDIPVDGRGVFSNSITIYFSADLWPQIGGKPYSVIYTNNPTFGGFFRMAKDCQSGFLVVNTIGDPETNPDAANVATDISEERMIELVRAGAGVADLAVKIDGVARWRSVADVARAYQRRRIFLAGDAAHVMPPNGGFGGNTGIHDAHNLAWKLALVLRGVAGPTLVDSYEPERRPVGKFTVEQAYSRYVTRTASYLGATDYQPVAPDFDVEIGYLYRSAAILSDDDDDKICDDPRANGGRPGARAPHVWLERDGQRLSSLDLLGRRFVLLAGPDGADWCEAAAKSARTYKGFELDAHRVGGPSLQDPDGQFTEAYGLSASGAVLVRPDGFIAWRAGSRLSDQAGAVSHALATALMKQGFTTG